MAVETWIQSGLLQTDPTESLYVRDHAVSLNELAKAVSRMHSRFFNRPFVDDVLYFEGI